MMPNLLKFLLGFTALSAAAYFVAFQESANGDLIIAPDNKRKTPVAFVFFQGAEITPDQYKDTMMKIQAQVDNKYSLWIGVPQFPGDLANPAVTGAGYNRVLKSMQEQGLPKDAKIFVGGHSLGGAMVPVFGKDKQKELTGLIQFGAYLTRQTRDYIYIPSLQLGGELDGLTPVMRMAESFYFAVDKHANPTPYIATTVSYFIDQSMTNVTNADLAKQVQQTRVLITPLLDAMKLEGSYHLKQPCKEDPHTPKCQIDCPWTTQYSQYIMAGFADLEAKPQVNNHDEFHDVDHIPVHLPKIDNICDKPEGCVLQTHTVTQAVYSQLSDMDVAPFNSADELRTKLSSRQRSQLHAGYQNVDFNVTDAPNICAEINQMSFDWAWNNSSPEAQKRYNEFGEKYVMGTDIGPYNEGPKWIWNGLEYNERKNGTSKDYIEVQSVMMKTPENYIVQAAAGFHYCKVLSPARSIEWIYMGGLKKYMGIKN